MWGGSAVTEDERCLTHKEGQAVTHQAEKCTVSAAIKDMQIRTPLRAPYGQSQRDSK